MAEEYKRWGTTLARRPFPRTSTGVICPSAQDSLPCTDNMTLSSLTLAFLAFFAFVSVFFDKSLILKASVCVCAVRAWCVRGVCVCVCVCLCVCLSVCLSVCLCDGEIQTDRQTQRGRQTDRQIQRSHYTHCIIFKDGLNFSYLAP